MRIGLGHYEMLRDGKIKPPLWMATFRCDIPPRRKGLWHIEKMDVELDMANLRMMCDYRGCIPGTYTRLVYDKHRLVMSDTTAEIMDHREPWARAKGRCLIHGLGLGCLLQAVLAKEEVEHMDVVEVDEDLIELVGPYFTDPRVHIIHGDAFTHRFPKGERWDMVWHDIWDTICKDNLSEMIKLHRRYGGRCDWQGSWCRDLCEAVR